LVNDEFGSLCRPQANTDPESIFVAQSGPQSVPCGLKSLPVPTLAACREAPRRQSPLWRMEEP
jgi:hypothetical protein